MRDENVRIFIYLTFNWFLVPVAAGEVWTSLLRHMLVKLFCFFLLWWIFASISFLMLSRKICWSSCLSFRYIFYHSWCPDMNGNFLLYILFSIFIYSKRTLTFPSIGIFIPTNIYHVIIQSNSNPESADLTRTLRRSVLGQQECREDFHNKNISRDKVQKFFIQCNIT